MRDRDVRNAVRGELSRIHSGDHDTRIIEEMGIWSSTARIDIAVVNGELCGFELKSARDNLKRLPDQQTIYSAVFDRVTLVTAENHLAASLRVIPDWWGISVASTSDGQVCLAPERTAEFNPEISALMVARLLWRDEALAILSKFSLDKGYRSKPVAVLHERLVEAVSLSTLRDETRAMIKARVYS